jgi:hypothetical protein
MYSLIGAAIVLLTIALRLSRAIYENFFYSFDPSKSGPTQRTMLCCDHPEAMH